jgi:hypothetical protein
MGLLLPPGPTPCCCWPGLLAAVCCGTIIPLAI